MVSGSTKRDNAADKQKRRKENAMCMQHAIEREQNKNG